MHKKMNKLKIAINGFGRIGRITFKALLQNPDIQVVAVNDLTDIKTLAHLLKFDSVHGKFDAEISFEEKNLIVNGNTVKVLAEKDPAQLPWKDLGVDLVLESTGRFTDEAGAGKHLEAGAKKVVISAPAKGANIKTLVLGVNDKDLKGDEKIVSNASCTTNCLAPMVKVIDDLAGVESGFMVTIHAYTADQNLIDGPHKDLRRARAAAVNIVPTSTGAASATGLVLPHLKGKLDGNAYRVPTPTGSITDFTCQVKNDVSKEQVNEAFKKAGANELKGILLYSTDALVSSDIVGNEHSCIFDSGLTMVSGKSIKVGGWYDNEAGYSQRTADLINMIRERWQE
jgi:glyceraldehyde 3-phosphate dehydrogenase